MNYPVATLAAQPIDSDSLHNSIARLETITDVLMNRTHADGGAGVNSSSEKVPQSAHVLSNFKNRIDVVSDELNKVVDALRLL